MPHKQSNIQRKLMQLVVVTSGAVLLLTCIGFFTYEFFAYRQNNKSRMTTLGQIIAANSTSALAFDSPEDADEILSALKADKHVIKACLYDSAGNLFSKYPLTLSNNNFPLHPVADGYNYEDGFLKSYLPVEHDKKRLGTLYLQSDLRIIYERLQRYTLIALLVIALSALAAYFISKKLQKQIAKPIIALVRTAADISNKNNYAVRAEKFEDDEFGTLTDAFNHMLSQIERQNAEIISFNHALEIKVAERTKELKQANKELKLKSEFEETIIDSSVDIIAVFDKDLNYITLNKYGRETYGLKNKSFIGKNIVEVFPKMENSVMYHNLQKVLAKGEMMIDYHYTSQLSDRVLQNYFVPLFNEENILYRILVIGHDITEISKANEKLKRVNKELEKSNQDLEQFAFVASHDLQEPLRKIQTFSQLLDLKIDDTQAVRMYLTKIVSSAKRMTDLIKAVLNYSRLTSEKEHFEEVDLNEVVDSIKNDLELIIVEKNVIITTDRLPVIRANKLQLNQLFLNLISNSIKFSKRPPEITISSAIIDKSEIEITNDNIDAEKYVELHFTDNGIGFDQQYAEKIFTVFQRLHGKLEYPGTGIGLALCKKIIDKHNGNILVVSKAGEGTTFTIQLPLTISSYSHAEHQ